MVMKYAMTADGKIATRTGASKWITGEAARAEVQKLRRRCMGIMAGIGTVLADDPMLNVRIEGGRSPIRIICDSDLRIPPDSQICRTAKEFPTIVACAAARLRNREEKIVRLERLGIQVIQTFGGKETVDLKELMRILGGQGIDSILLEGGGTLNDSALQAGIVKEIQAFVAPKIFGGNEAKTPVAGRGIDLPDEAVHLALEKISQIGEDLLLEYKVCENVENI